MTRGSGEFIAEEADAKLGSRANDRSFLSYYRAFFTRYSAEELAHDIRIFMDTNALQAEEADAERSPEETGAEKAPRLVALAETYFLSDHPTEEQRLAVMAVRLGGVSRRTIQYWKSGHALYSERSSRGFNSQLDCVLGKDDEGRVSRRMLAGLWMAGRLKLTAAELDAFCTNCMHWRSPYALDIVEWVLRVCADHNSRASLANTWPFFEALSFALEARAGLARASESSSTHAQQIAERVLARVSSRKTESIADDEDGADALLDDLCLLYEEGLALLGAHRADESAAANVTYLLSDSWHRRFSTQALDNFAQGGAAEPNNEQADKRSDAEQPREQVPAGTVVRLQGAIQGWIANHAEDFAASRLNYLLAVLALFIELVRDRAKQATTDEAAKASFRSCGWFFEAWYFICTHAVLGANQSEPGKEEVPFSCEEMADILLREQGEQLYKYARQRCLTYLKRIFGDSAGVSRQRFIEFYLLARLNHARKSELEVLLKRQRFSALDKDEDKVLLALFEQADLNPAARLQALAFADLMTQVALDERTADLQAQRTASKTHSERPANSLPVGEKLFAWKYGR